MSSIEPALRITGPDPKIGIVFGSASDWPTMRSAVEALEALDLPCEYGVVSAHRTPDRLRDYAQHAASRGIEAIIAGAGGAAHLPGMIAAWSSVPVLGVPIESRTLKGMDSLLSIVQMPGGVPVGTLAIGSAGAKNAGLLAARILANQDPELRARIDAQRTEMARAALAADLPE